MSVPKIRSGLRLRVVSDTRDALEIKSMVAQLQASKKGSRYERYFPDGRDPDRDGENFVFEYHPARLTLLPHMRICDTANFPASVNLHVLVPFDRAAFDALLEFAARAAAEPIGGLMLSCYVSASGQPCQNVWSEYSYECGWRWRGDQKRFFVGLTDHIKLPDAELRTLLYAHSPASAELAARVHARRAQYLAKAIEAMGLEHRVQVTFDGSDLRVTATEADTLWISGADLQGRNPGCFELYLPTFDEARGHLLRALQNRDAVARIDSLDLGLMLAPSDYERLLEELNALAEGWVFDFYGSYADAIDPYTAEASRSPDGRLPVFVWMPHKTYTFFQADVVPRPEGRRLEIDSNCGDMKRLFKEAESATGVKFTPAQGCAPE